MPILKRPRAREQRRTLVRRIAGEIVDRRGVGEDDRACLRRDRRRRTRRAADRLRDRQRRLADVRVRGMSSGRALFRIVLPSAS